MEFMMVGWWVYKNLIIWQNVEKTKQNAWYIGPSWLASVACIFKKLTHAHTHVLSVTYKEIVLLLIHEKVLS